MVALDLDGTLLHSNHQMSDSTVEYLRYLDEKGFIICFATGRSAPTVYEQVIRLNLPHPLPVVCSNGAQGLLLQSSVTCGAAGRREGGEEPAKYIDFDIDQTTNIQTSVPLVSQPSSSFHTTITGTGTAGTGTPGTSSINSQCLFSIPVPELVARQTISLAQTMGYVTQYYVGDAIYANPTAPHHYELTKRYSTLTGSKTEHIIPVVSLSTTTTTVGNSTEAEHDNHDDDDDDEDYFTTTMLAKGLPTKQVVLFPTEEQDAAMEAFETMFQQHQNGINNNNNDQARATIVRGSLGWFLEVLHPDVTKGSGLQRLCNTAEYQSLWNNNKSNNNNLTLLQSVVAFGDADNDLEFLQMAGWGIAMVNGRQVAKDVADEITKYTNDEDGVVKALQEMEAQGLLEFWR